MVVAKWYDAVLMKFPRVDEVTREMVEAATRQTELMAYCGVRLATGRLSTTEALENRRREAMKPLSLRVQYS